MSQRPPFMIKGLSDEELRMTWVCEAKRLIVPITKHVFKEELMCYRTDDATVRMETPKREEAGSRVAVVPHVCNNDRFQTASFSRPSPTLSCLYNSSIHHRVGIYCTTSNELYS